MKQQFVFMVMVSLFLGEVHPQTQMGLDIDGKTLDEESGTSTALTHISTNSSFLVVGASVSDSNGTNSGQARIYEYDGNNWTQIGQDIAGNAEDELGTSVSISSNGNIIAIGAPYGDGVNGANSGQVYVYKYNGIDAWEPLGQIIDGEAAGDRSGTSVSLSSSGDTLAIGAPFNKGGSWANGHVRVFKSVEDTNNPGTFIWEQLGGDIDGEASGDQSGTSVSLSGNGNYVAIGAPFNDGSGSASGHVRVYQYNGIDTWNQTGIDIDGETGDDRSGSSVALSNNGDYVTIGAPLNDGNGNASGHVRVYQYDGAWEQIGDDIDGETDGDRSGSSVSISSNGRIVAIGAPYNDGNGAYSGHTRVYRCEGDIWNQIGIDIDGEEGNNRSGFSVSLTKNANALAIGAPLNNNSDGHVRVYDLSATLSSTNTLVSQNITIYPNPAKDNIVIQLLDNLEFKLAKLYNALGQLVIKTAQPTIDISHISKGVYYVEVITREEQKATKKIAVMN